MQISIIFFAFNSGILWGNHVRTPVAFTDLESWRVNLSVLTLMPNLPNKTNVLIIIPTTPSKSERRNTLRETWAKQISYYINTSSSSSNSVIRIAYFFAIALEGNPYIDKEIEKESAIQGDILRVNLLDTYRGLVTKLLLTYEWVVAMDIKPDFIVKADDDIYVKIPKLVRWLQESSNPPTKLYAGLVLRNIEVIRDPKNRWYLSEQEYQEKFYPDYCKGLFYILSGDLFPGIVNASKETEPFPIEDAYIALLVKKIGVTPKSTGRDFFNNIVPNSPQMKVQLATGVVLGDSLSPEEIKLIHRAYTGT